MTLEPTLVADVLVNLFGAGGTVVVARETSRHDPKGYVARRIVYALYFVAALFVVRSWSWYSLGSLADALADAMASALPLMSLLVAEGLLRRHAPRSMKVVLAAAPLAVFVTKLLPLIPYALPVVLLMVTVLGGFVAIAALLWRRDASTVSAAENATIRGVLLALVLLAPLIATDFRSILPLVPVRLGALGALLLCYIGLGVGNYQGSLRWRIFNLVMFACIAGLFAAGYLLAGFSDRGTDHLIAVGAVGFAGLLFAALFSESQGASLERMNKSARITEARDAADLMHRLQRHPLLSGAQMLPGEVLAEVDHPAFHTLLAQNPTLRQASAPWEREGTDPGVERALSLMAAYEATHLALVTEQPLRILALSLPATAADPRAETDIDVIRLVGELLYAKAAAA